MVLELTPQLKAVLIEHAQRRGVMPEVLVIDALRERFLPADPITEPQDEWEQRLFGAAVECGLSVPNSVLSSDGLYE